MRKSISSGLVGLTALSTVGNLIISLPITKNDGSDILSVIIAAAFSFALFIFVYPLLEKFMNSEKMGNGIVLRVIRIAVYLLLQAVLILITVTTLCDFSAFTVNTVLPNRDSGLIFAVFAVTAFIIGTNKMSALSKTATIFLIITVLLTAIIFLLSIPDMTLKYLTPREDLDLFGTTKTAFSVFISSFAQSFLICVASGAELRDKRSALIGSAIGGVIIVLCLLNTLLVFGGEFSGELSYPYISAVKTVGTGDVFSGMEGFLYVTVFLSCIMKTAFSFFGIKLLSLKISKIKNFQ